MILCEKSPVSFRRFLQRVLVAQMSSRCLKGVFEQESASIYMSEFVLGGWCLPLKKEKSQEHYISMPSHAKKMAR